MNIFSRYIRAMKQLAFRVASVCDDREWVVWYIQWCIDEMERAMWWMERYFLLKNRIRRIYEY